MVIGNNLFSFHKADQSDELSAEFVFVNCCYLGKIDGGDQQL